MLQLESILGNLQARAEAAALVVRILPGPGESPGTYLDRDLLPDAARFANCSPADLKPFPWLPKLHQAVIAAIAHVDEAEPQEERFVASNLEVID
jgi:hypothetical protein